ncbi:MAG: Dicer-like protein 2, partial [Candelina submexicana]
MESGIEVPCGEDEVSSDEDSISFDAASDLALDSEVERIVDLTGDTSNIPDEPSVDILSEESSPAVLRPRAYQLEMLDEGLQRNIIIAVCWLGMLWTQAAERHLCITSFIDPHNFFRAILRIAAELERCPAEQLIWFSCPTVALCEQQFAVISSQLPAFQCRILKGSDNVEHWSDQRLWDAVLKNVRVVVSTPKILLDALTHGFVRLNSIALLVFDEAHNCTKRNAANMIMQDFYYRSLQDDSTDSIPHILGLTASPVLNARAGGLDIIERNLNAISKTPRINRQEMMEFVHPPIFKTLLYQIPSIDRMARNAIRTLGSLTKAYLEMDIAQDPYVLSLASSTNPNDQRKLRKALQGRRTYCQDQMKRFWSQSHTIFDQLGAFGCNYYICTCIKQFLKTEDPNMSGWIQLTNDEKKYLARVLQQVEIDEPSLEFSVSGPLLSHKTELLIDLLVDESIPNFAGLVFVEQRATVAVLSYIISVHPRTRHLLECGTF